jgi:hypothetical protein
MSTSSLFRNVPETRTVKESIRSFFDDGGVAAKVYRFSGWLTVQM